MQQNREPKIYCPRCGSYSVFTFRNKKKHQDWALCRKCWYKKHPDYFCIDYDDGYWQHVDDQVHDYINEHW